MWSHCIGIVIGTVVPNSIYDEFSRTTKVDEIINANTLKVSWNAKTNAVKLNTICIPRFGHYYVISGRPAGFAQAPPRDPSRPDHITSFPACINDMFVMRLYYLIAKLT